MKLVEFFKSLDLFSEPVQFNTGRQRYRKKTVIGAFITIFIIVTTLIYFIYQSYLYFSGKMDPKFRSQTFVSNDINIQVNNEMFGFDFFNIYEGLYLHQRQEKLNKTYIVFVGTFVLTNGTKNEIIYLDIVKCQNESITFFNIQFPIFTEVLALSNSTLALLLLLGSPCRRLAQKFIRRDIFFILMQEFFSGTYLNILEHNKIVSFDNQCKENQIVSDDQIQEKVNGENEERKKNFTLPCITPKSSLKVFNQLYQTNDEASNQDYIKEDFDTQARQPEGFLDMLRINDAKLVKQTKSDKQGAEFQMPLKIYNPNQKDYTPKIFRKKYSNLQQPEQEMKESNYSLINNQSIFNKHEKILKKVDQSNFIEAQESNQKSILNQARQINQCFQTLNDNSLKLKLEQIIFQPKFIKRKEYLFSKGLKQEIAHEVQTGVEDSLDFFTFYKEILLLKKAIMMILNKEQLAALQIQFAALQVIGIDIEKIDKHSENNIMANYLETHVNHFKEQYEIQQSKKLQSHYINNFLKRCLEDKQNLDNIDKRILSSLLFVQQN
ncbi:hypothetical protein ABPG74_007729 [Tetrahymena malaccensis]